MDTLPHERQIADYLKTIDHLKRQSENNTLFNSEIMRLEQKLDKLKKQIYSELTAWERVMICRHPNRPNTIDYIEKICDSFVELHGDRAYAEDSSVVGGLAKIGEMDCVIVGQEKGNDTQSRIERNFGMLQPEGFRKALRLMKLAEKFGLPIVSLLDTPGAFPGLEAEERGQGWAIANNLKEMSRIGTPIIIVVIGEGCSGGALGMGVGDKIGMLEHAYYSVISPEGCASILWKDATKKIESAEMLKLNAEHLKQFELIDTIIEEPDGGAHHQPEMVFEGVKTFILGSWRGLRHLQREILIEQRYLKFRKMGQFNNGAI